MIDLADWLRAALDRVEAVARAAAEQAPTPWKVEVKSYEDSVYIRAGDSHATEGESCGCCDRGTLARQVAENIVANDPARVLRTVAAHRTIMGQLEHALADDATDETALWMLSTLGAIYSDRPGYLTEWEVR